MYNGVTTLFSSATQVYKMITIPYRIAKMIVLDKIHPVAAWRNYYGLSQQALAQSLGMSEQEISRLEKSNNHLMDETLNKISRTFGIVPDALKIRYNSYQEINHA